MRLLFGLATVFLLACSPQEEVSYTASVNVDLTQVPALLTERDQLTDNALDIPHLVELAHSVTLDQEKQALLNADYSGEPTTLLFHVWREQPSWVHLYFSTPSEDLMKAIEAQTGRFARSDPEA